MPPFFTLPLFRMLKDMTDGMLEASSIVDGSKRQKEISWEEERARILWQSQDDTEKMNPSR